MRVVRFDVALQSNKQLTLNDLPMEHTQAAPVVEEAVLARNADPRELFMLVCAANKLAALLSHAYTKARVKHGELDGDGRPKITSGLRGVNGTSLPDLTTRKP